MRGLETFGSVGSQNRLSDVDRVILRCADLEPQPPDEIYPDKIMVMPPGLTAKQLRFIDEYLVDGNGTRAAIAGGYSAGWAHVAASTTLRIHKVAAEVKARQAADAERLGLSRQRVVAGLLQAVEQARTRQDPMAMVSALREIGRLMGFYAPERVEGRATGLEWNDAAGLASASNEELIQVIQTQRR